jgi:hypothetical protein
LLSPKRKKARRFPGGPLREISVWIVRLRADACQAVQGTVMMAVMRVADERHEGYSVIERRGGSQAARPAHQACVALADDGFIK